MAKRIVTRPDQVNVRISDQGKWCLLQLQEFYGLSQAGVMEMILREKARAVGFIVPAVVGSQVQLVEPTEKNHKNPGGGLSGDSGLGSPDKPTKP